MVEFGNTICLNLIRVKYPIFDNNIIKDKRRNSINRIIINIPCEIPSVYRKSLYVPILFVLVLYLLLVKIIL